MFFIDSSEEMGGPQETRFNWLGGSYEYVQAHPGVVDKIVLDLNLDMLSLKQASGKYWVEQRPEANALVGKALSDLGLTGMVGYYIPTYSWVDGWSFYGKGGATALKVLWAADPGTIYHAQLDTMAYADPEPLGTLLDLYTLLAVRADHALVLPIDLSGTVGWASAQLAAYQAPAPSEGIYLASALEALDELKEQIAPTNSYAESLRSSYAAASGGEKAAIEAQAHALNQKLFEARKIINVWSLGEGGSAGGPPARRHSVCGSNIAMSIRATAPCGRIRRFEYATGRALSDTPEIDVLILYAPSKSEKPAFLQSGDSHATAATPYRQHPTVVRAGFPDPGASHE